MGAYYQSYIIRDTKAEPPTIRNWFRQTVDQCRWESGHGGYTGTFAEKRGLRFMSGTWTLEDAENHCEEENDKWGTAYAYRLTDGRWYVGGWCSS